MSEVKCPSCGASVPVPEKKSTNGRLIGCIVAVVLIPVFLGVFGLVAAIAIPSFVKARQKAQEHGCVANLKQIDFAKEQYMLQVAEPDSVEITSSTLQSFFAEGAPICPAEGTYSYNPAGVPATCSVHGGMATAGSQPGPAYQSEP